eukprot:gene22013-29071_t
MGSVTEHPPGGSTEYTTMAADAQLPPGMDQMNNDLLLSILSWLPDKDLLCAYAVVCKAWRVAAYSPYLWEQVVSPAALGLPNKAHPQLYFAAHARNFLRNPCFLEARNNTPVPAWILNASGGNGVSWEFPPCGTSTFEGEHVSNPPAPLPYPHKTTSKVDNSGIARRLRNYGQPALRLAAGVGQPSLESKAEVAESEGVSGCVATSFGWAELVQVVDLYAELQRRGLTPEEAEQLLASESTLGFSILVGARSDQEGQFSVGLMLDGGQGGILMASGEGHQHGFSGNLKTGPNGEWRRFSMLVGVPVGCRRVTVVLRGKDKSYWAGFYGTKFASAELRFVVESERELFTASRIQ